MKAIKYFSTGLILLLGIFGCKKDLLDTVQYDAVSSSNIWTSTNMATLAMNGVYNALLQNLSLIHI